MFSITTAFNQEIEKPYDYPVKRGTSEWYSIKTYDSLRKVCQIPSNIVDKMSTSLLLESIINYPLIGDVLVFESYKKGLENLANNFNAFATIIQRSDLDAVLLHAYSIHLDKNLDSSSAIEKGEHSVQMSFFELLINHSFQHNKIKGENSQLFLNQLLKAFNEKKNNPEVYGIMSLSTCVWAINGILLIDKASEKFAMKEVFIQKGNTFSDTVIKRIVNEAENYLRQTNEQTN